MAQVVVVQHFLRGAVEDDLAHIKNQCAVGKMQCGDKACTASCSGSGTSLAEMDCGDSCDCTSDC